MLLKKSPKVILPWLTPLDKQQDQQYVVDLTKYKGIYYNDDNKKFQDEETGAHFEYHDLCRRLVNLQKWRQKLEDKEQEKAKKVEE